MRAHRTRRSAARAYPAKSQATPEQLRVPAGYLALIAQSGPNQGTRSRHCPRVAGGGGRKLKGICLVIIWHRTLRVFVPFVPQPVWVGKRLGCEAVQDLGN